MAHSFKVVPEPLSNKNGTPSKTRRRYKVVDRTRGGTRLIGYAKTKKDIPALLDQAREAALESHLRRHPNDLHFQRKHGLTS